LTVDSGQLIVILQPAVALISYAYNTIVSVATIFRFDIIRWPWRGSHYS